MSYRVLGLILVAALCYVIGLLLASVTFFVYAQNNLSAIADPIHTSQDANHTSSFFGDLFRMIAGYHSHSPTLEKALVEKHLGQIIHEKHINSTMKALGQIILEKHLNFQTNSSTNCLVNPHVLC